MAIGSEAPVGEVFGRFKVVNNLIDKEEYDQWAAWFGEQVRKHGLLFGYAKICYTETSLQKRHNAD